ncbi:MAG: pyruvate dehydrogenase (acetyl-transferring), homodimeric type, partial [Candidatus Latescibacterota bacterium]
QGILEDRYGVPTDVWSVTSFRQLHQDGLDAERWNWMHAQEAPRVPWISRCLEGLDGAFVVASDFLKALPSSVAQWFPRRPVALGTDGFGRSDSRAALRRFFEIDAETMAWAALADLYRQGRIPADCLDRAVEELGIEPDKTNPIYAC